MRKYAFCILFAALACVSATNANAKKNSTPTPEEKGLSFINRESAEAFARKKPFRLILWLGLLFMVTLVFSVDQHNEFIYFSF